MTLVRTVETTLPIVRREEGREGKVRRSRKFEPQVFIASALTPLPPVVVLVAAT